MLAISKIIGFENSKTPHNGFKSCFEWYKFCFSGLVFLRFRPKIDRFLVVSCDVLKQCEESVTIIDGECARFAKNILCKIFIILAYSQYRRYKYSSCTPEGVPELHTTVAWEAHIRTILDCKFIFITIHHYTHHHSA